MSARVTIKGDQTYEKTYFPAPFAPTTAIRESKPTSISTFLRMTLSDEYPKETLDSCNNGGEILSQSGKLGRSSVEFSWIGQNQIQTGMFLSPPFQEVVVLAVFHEFLFSTELGRL